MLLKSKLLSKMQKNILFATKQRECKDAALQFEYSLSLRAANHNISGAFNRVCSGFSERNNYRFLKS